MSEQEKFREVEPLRDAGGLLMTSARSETQWIYPSSAILDIAEARALRDWLDKALPEQTVTVCWTVPADEESTP